MLKSILIRSKYYYHVLQYHHHDLLQEDCLCEKLKIELKVKATYHNSKVIELGSKL